MRRIFRLRQRATSRQTLLHFTRQLRVFTRSGIALDEAIRIIADESEDASLRSALSSILKTLDTGASLSDGFDMHPKVFPPYFVGLIRSAEETGAFVETLDSLIGYQSRVIETRAKISSALAYPSIVMALALVTVAILAGFVIPRFEPLFEELGSTVPLPTRILLNATSMLTDNLFLICGLFAGLVAAFVASLRSARIRRRIDSLVLRIPFIGTIIQYVMLERFCRILSATVRSGLPVTAGMRLSTQTISNAVHRDLLTRAARDMAMGIDFAAALARTGLFPGAARQMFRVGEETGALDEQVTAAGEFFDAELEMRMRRFTSLFEPFLIVFVGLVVGFVAVALVSAMYGVLDGVRDIP
ncbi:MAG: type II secretion system F family protein [Actinomycetota bacterium]